MRDTRVLSRPPGALSRLDFLLLKVGTMTSAAYVASTIQRTGSTAPHRSGHTALAANQSRPTVTDDYERKYCILISLASQSEVM